MKNLIIAYVFGDVIQNMREEDIRMLSGINLAFGNVKDDEFANPDFGEDLSVIAKYKAINPDLFVTISMGGAGRGGYSTACRTKEGMEKLVRTSVAFMRKWDLDGIDIDWEFPCHPEYGPDGCPEDRDNFPLLMKAYRDLLDEAEKEDHKHYYLTIAGSSCDDFLKCTQPDKYIDLIDYIQIMTYDMRDQKNQFEVPEGQEILSGHHTGLYTTPGDIWDASVDGSVRAYMKWGIPAEKIVIGSAFYSRKWPNVGPENHGMFQHSAHPFSSGPRYGTLVREYLNKNGWVRYWDDDAKAPYLHNGMDFISYDDPDSIREKCKYVQEKGLKGIMFWEYGCDDTYTLLQAHYDALK